MKPLSPRPCRAWRFIASLCAIAVVSSVFASLAATVRADDTPTAPLPVAVPRATPPHVLIKIDDLVAYKGYVNPRWIKVTDFLQQRKIKAGIGIICNSLEGDNPRYLQWIKDEQAGGLVEFWCHGYDHKQWDVDDPDHPGQKKTLQEFHGTPFEHQRDDLVKSETLAKEKLGFTLPAFGSGFNSLDENTVKALEATPDVAIWLYGDAKHPAGKVVLTRNSVNIEYPTFNPDVDQFVRTYNTYPNRDYFLIQGHPAQWTDERFAQFVKIIDFLQSQGAIFDTPSGYVAAHHFAPGTVAP